MDEQEKQDDQKIQGDQRELLLKIAHCNIADRILDLLISGMDEKEILDELRNERGEGNKRQSDDSVCIDNCVKICSHQKELLEASDSKQEFTKAMFHVPEPWNGNLKTAEILFVGSNPNINLKEDFPKFESEEWSEDKKNEVVVFFSDRLNRLDLENDIKNTRYWREIYKYAAWILEATDPSWAVDKENEEDKKREIDSRVALTEIVHCKSKDETGVPEATQKCFKKYTKKVIEYFLNTTSGSGNKKIVVFVGAKARDLICAGASTNTNNVDRKKIAKYFGVSSENALFLCFPHPSPKSTQWKTWNSGKVVKLGDRKEGRKREETIKKIIYEELKQYGYSLPS